VREKKRGKGESFPATIEVMVTRWRRRVLGGELPESLEKREKEMPFSLASSPHPGDTRGKASPPYQPVARGRLLEKNGNRFAAFKKRPERRREASSSLPTGFPSTRGD